MKHLHPFNGLAILFASLVFFSFSTSIADAPSWWTDRNVLNSVPAKDFAAVNAGQVKWIASNAFDELEANLPGGAGPALTAAISAFPPDKNFSTVNHGQLKTLAKPFYDRLIAERFVMDFPWTAATEDDDNFAVANIGQVKNLFSFDLTKDTDNDGMPDMWETANGLNPFVSADAEEDLDQDSISNLNEFIHGTDPQDPLSRPTIMVGTGVPEDPFLIFFTSQLQAMTNDLSASYLLMANLDFTLFDVGDGDGFLPVGTTNGPFTGTFDAQNFTISNLRIHRPSTDDVGLFGSIQAGAEIENVSLIDADITGRERVGSLVGFNLQSFISFSLSSGSVTADGSAGGLVGNSASDTKLAFIVNCFSRANVSAGQQSAGGLVGNNSGRIGNSYATGNVQGDSSVGGFAGVNKTDGLIENCFSTGDVQGNMFVGGLVGHNELGAVVFNSFYNNTPANPSVCVGQDDGIVDCNTINDDQPHFFSITNAPMASWDFRNIWNLRNDGIDFPVLFRSLPDFPRDRFIVKFAPGVIQLPVGQNEAPIENVTITAPSVVVLNEKFNVSSVRRLVLQNITPEVENYFIFRVPLATSFASLINDYTADPNVIFAEPDFYLSIAQAFTPNDTDFPAQFAHTLIDSEFAWDVERGDPSVTIAIIDTGVDFAHDDLAGNMLAGCTAGCPVGTGHDFVNYPEAGLEAIGMVLYNTGPEREDYEDEDEIPSDFNGHGTHVSGIAAAVSDNANRIAGMAHNCRIMPLRTHFAVANSPPGYARGNLADVARAINYAANNDADVINMSLGGQVSPPDTLIDFVRIAFDLDVVLIAAVGNQGDSIESFPAALPEVVAVGTTDENDARSGFSNFGPWVDLAAPGGIGNGMDILSTVPTSPTGFPELPSNASGQKELAGTSQSAPFVAGLAALIRSRYPEMSNDAVIRALLQGVDRFDGVELPVPDQPIGVGRINALKSLTRIDTDCDGINDHWEKTYGFDITDITSPSVLTDSDGDGWNDRNEGIAGLDPSVYNPMEFKLTEIGTTPTEVILELKTFPGNTYAIKKSLNLNTGPFQEILTFVGAPGETHTTVTVPLTTPKGFFRGSARNLILCAGIFPSSDVDCDGINDVWEIQHGFPVDNPFQPSAFQDSDGDGVNDREEGIAGTDANVPDSFLGVLDVRTEGGDTAVDISTFPGNSYSLEGATLPLLDDWTELTSFFGQDAASLTTVLVPLGSADSFRAVPRSIAICTLPAPPEVCTAADGCNAISSDGTADISVPAGALPGDTTLTVETLLNGGLVDADFGVCGTFVGPDCATDGFISLWRIEDSTPAVEDTFLSGKLATIILTYDDTGLTAAEESALKIFRSAGVEALGGPGTTELTIVARDVIDNKIAVLVDHLSLFGIARANPFVVLKEKIDALSLPGKAAGALLNQLEQALKKLASAQSLLAEDRPKQAGNKFCQARAKFGTLIDSVSSKVDDGQITETSGAELINLAVLAQERIDVKVQSAGLEPCN